MICKKETIEKEVYRCSYCDYTAEGDEAPYDVEYHERRCIKNPEVQKFVKDAVGEIYKVYPGHLVKVIKLNPRWTYTDPGRGIGILRNGDFSQSIPLPELSYPFIVKYISGNDEGGYSFGYGYCAADLNRCKTATEDEWNELISKCKDSVDVEKIPTTRLGKVDY